MTAEISRSWPSGICCGGFRGTAVAAAVNCHEIDDAVFSAMFLAPGLIVILGCRQQNL